MKGDFTRFTFAPGKQYDAVLMQQGRVQTDADWNEQVMIADRRNRLEMRDIIGPTGAPQDLLTNAAASFLVSYGPDEQGINRLFINGGRYYINGQMVEGEAPRIFTGQPGGTLPPAQGDGIYLVYLDVWRRHITALEDPAIREVALGGADTGTRAQLVWQARLERVGDFSANLVDIPPDQYGPGWQPAGAASTGALDVAAGGTPLENQLYRVEIHRGGPAGEASFKWSRDNGTVVARVLTHSTPVLSEDAWSFSVTIDQIGRDSFSSFLPGHWVELCSEELVLQRKPGLFLMIASVAGDTLNLVAERNGNALDVLASDSPDENPLKGTLCTLRRWDNQWNPDAADLAHMDPQYQTPDGRVLLERDITVAFAAAAPGGGEATYQTGDYWLIPARTVSGLEGWTPGQTQPPAGEQHEYAPLALVKVDASGVVTDLLDMRAVFPTLRSLIGGTGGIVTGTGTGGRVPKWHSHANSTLVDSSILESSTDTGAVVSVDGSLSVYSAHMAGTGVIAGVISMFTSSPIQSMSPEVASAVAPTAKGVKDFVDRAVPPGTVMAYASESVPPGWLECDGFAYDVATQEHRHLSDLFDAIGKRFGGGNGSPTQFNVPDLRGRFVRGWSHDSGTDPDAGSRWANVSEGQTGDHVGSYQDDHYRSHDHSWSGGVAIDQQSIMLSHSHTYTTHKELVGQFFGVEMNMCRYTTNATTDTVTQDASHAHNGSVWGTVSPSGGSETRPKNVYLMYIIKY